MCNNETHFELNPSAHLTLHTIEVKKACSMIRFGREGASVDDAEANANEAWELAQSPDIVVSVACVHMLEAVRKGSLRSGEQLQSA